MPVVTPRGPKPGYDIVVGGVVPSATELDKSTSSPGFRSGAATMSHMATFGRRKAPVEAAPEAATAAAPEAATAAAPEVQTPRKRKHKATPTVSPFPESHDSEWQ